MIKVKTLEEFLAELRSFARVKYPEVDTGEGSVVADLIFKTTAFAGSKFIEELSRIASFFDVYKLSGDELEYEASKYGIERSSGEKAKGKVVFYSLITPPPEGIEIPKGTRVAGISADGMNLIYETTQRAVILSTDYKTDTSRYEKEVEVQAIEPGTMYNVGPGVVNLLIDPIPNIAGVENRGLISGGSDEETDDELRERIIKAVLGRDIGTKNGYELLIEKQFGLVDSRIIAPYEEDYERLDGVDIFVITDEKEEVQESFVAAVNGDQTFVLTFQPVAEVVSVEVNGNPATFVFNKDTSVYGRSVRAKDSISVSGLTAGDTVSVIYSFYSRVGEIQNFVNRRENKIPGTGLLVKRAKKFLLHLELEVGFFANVNVDQVKQDIENALVAFLNTKDLGEPIDESDIISVVQNGFGDIVIEAVDYVIVKNFYAVEEADPSDVINPVDRRISVDSKSYIRFGSVTYV